MGEGRDIEMGEGEHMGLKANGSRGWKRAGVGQHRALGALSRKGVLESYGGEEDATRPDCDRWHVLVERCDCLASHDCVLQGRPRHARSGRPWLCTAWQALTECLVSYRRPVADISQTYHRPVADHEGSVRP